ncbi:MAG: DUF84 family protein [Candidatus Heimdallarchaeaceae archaeon]
MSSIHVVICSQNPVKVQAAKEAFRLYYPSANFIAINVNGYPEVLVQPMSLEETIKSAIGRIKAAQKIEKADYYCALEGGVGKDQYGSFLTGYVYIVDKLGNSGVGGGYRMPLPDVVYQRLKNQEYAELGDIIDVIAGEHNTKQKGGAVSIFTNNRLTRKEIFRISTIMALVPFINEKFEKLKNEG